MTRAIAANLMVLLAFGVAIAPRADAQQVTPAHEDAPLGATPLWVGNDSRPTDEQWEKAGDVWTKATAAAPWCSRGTHASVVFENRLWVLGGANIGSTILGPTVTMQNDVWSSSDGATWNPVQDNAPWKARAGHTSLIFHNKIWVIGGSYLNSDSQLAGMNDVWYSSDGAAWTQATAAAQWPPRYFHASVVFDGQMWVIGGQDAGGGLNDVWCSSDGATWTQVTAAAQWTARDGHAAAVFNNAIWVLGGSGGTELNDVWYSPDGAAWTQATPAAQWSSRGWLTSIAFDNKIWVLGGGVYSDGGLENMNGMADVWSSPDGAAWTQVTDAAQYPPRAGQTMAVFNNRMWTLGGVNAGVARNDVWYSAAVIGSIHVNIQPAAAINAGAQWSIDGGITWHTYVETVNNVSTGTVTVTFKDIAGWVTPQDQAITITADQTVNATGTYSKQGRSVSVTMLPAAAVAAGAHWSIDGGAHWNNNAATLQNIAAAQVTITFQNIPDWTKPPDLTAAISLTAPVIETATYSPVQCALTISAIGQGTVALNPAGGTYPTGTTVTLTPTPAAGWQFDHWEGDLTGNASPASLVIAGNENVTAVFTSIIGCTPGALDKTNSLRPLGRRQTADLAVLAVAACILFAAPRRFRHS